MFKEVRSLVVITAQTFNPSIVSQPWLIKKDIVKEGEFLPGCLYASEVSQTLTEKFSLLVIEPQLQFGPRVPESEWGKLRQETISNFVRALPETPYAAMGINFTVSLVPAKETVKELERRLFFKADVPFAKTFEAADCRYGGYFSKDCLKGRLKLDIRPTALETERGKEDRLQFQFNFHRDLANGVNDILEHLGNWDEAKSIMMKTVDSVAK